MTGSVTGDGSDHGGGPPSRNGAAGTVDMAGTVGSAGTLGAAGPGGGDEVDWQDYLAATQRLDAVRRGSVSPGGRPADTARAAGEELTRLKAHLALQHSQLRALGVSESELRPTPAELAAVAGPMAAGPEPVLAALRQARTTVAATEGRMVGAGWSVRLATLLGRRRVRLAVLLALVAVVTALVGVALLTVL
nr:hypothetical protein [Micromonospora sp. DSM 115978]